MDCWIASFPRSGNTYFRNILYYVYGIESSTWHKETSYPVDDNYDKYRFVKTHLLPEDILPADPGIPGIYLVRDGRDAVVSIAHHRKDLVKPGSIYEMNLKEAILAADGSFFGGWSHNVEEWLQRADIVIRFEDLIIDPAKTFKRVEQLIDLPAPRWDNLPAFSQMKTGNPQYGGKSKLVDPKFKPEEFTEKFFRKGKSGGWKEEMSPYFQDLFWNYHGDTMERMGYESHNGSVAQNPLLDFKAMKKMGLAVPDYGNKKYKICIEASKLTDPVNDGVRRYLAQLLKRFEDITKNGDPRWEFKLLVGNIIYPLESHRKGIKVEAADKLHSYEKILMGFKKLVQFLLPVKIYKAISHFYKKTSIRKILLFVQYKTTRTKNKLLNKDKYIQKEITDLLHIPLPQNTVEYSELEQTVVVTVHDLTHKFFPEYHENANALLTEKGMKFILDKNADVIGVSQSTLDDLKSTYPIPVEKMHKVYEAADDELFRMNVTQEPIDFVREKYKIGNDDYFLCLSTIEPRKNLPNTIRAFNKFTAEFPEAKVNLVISGRYGWKTEHLNEELHLDNPRIIFTGYVDDNYLRVVYSEALALCYVSFYEGFGLPPLEAMRCRTPVIYGDNSSMKEIIGNAGLPANANDVNNILEQMRLIYTDSNLREELANRSLKRSYQLSGRKSIYDTLTVYEEIINKRQAIK